MAQWASVPSNCPAGEQEGEERDQGAPRAAML
jgi:hypothetical protein